MQELARTIAADVEARAKVGEDDEAEKDVQRLDQALARQERGQHDEQHGSQIERQQGIAKADGCRPVAIVQLVQPPMQGAVLVLGLFQHQG